MTNMLNRFNLRALFLVGACASQMHASLLWSSKFEVYDGIYDGFQYQTGNTLVYNSSVVGWNIEGFHAAHAVQVGTNDWALMVFSGFAGNSNVYTLLNPFLANESGTQYWVSYNIAPTVYQAPDQATRDLDVLQINVLNPLNAVVASTNVAPGAWDGTQTFQQKYFSYIGDGSGAVRLQIGSGNPDSGYFAGAIYDIAFWSSVPTSEVPEPSSFALSAAGAVAFAWLHRRLRGRLAM